MNRVAPEVAQEICVLLEQHHLDATTGEQQREHQSGGSATRDAHFGPDGLCAHPVMVPNGAGVDGSGRLAK